MMRRKSAQYFAVIFCFLIIGQDLSSGRVADEIIKRYQAKRAVEQDSSTETENFNVETKEIAVKSRKKRAGVAAVLFTTAFLVSLGTTGFQLYLAHNEGCCELPGMGSICTNEERFNKYKDKLKDLSDVIDDTYLDAETVFEWAQNINYRVNELWLKIERITSLNDQIVQGINPNIITELEATGQEVKDEVEGLNETVTAYSNADLNLHYATVWDDTKTALQTGFYLASYPLAFLAQQLINYVIRRSITKLAQQLNAKYGTILQTSLAGNGKAASFFGVRNAADVDLHVTDTAKAIQSAKHSKTSTWGPKVVDGLTIVTSLATIALDAWSVYQTWSDCEKLVDKVDDAADDIEEAYYDNVDLNTTVTDYLENVTYYYNDVREQLTSDDLDLVLEEIKNLTQYAANAERMQLAADAIDEWFANIDDADESETYDLLGTLNDGLGNISYTLECYRDKYRAISYISTHCADGDDTLANIYDTAVADFHLNDAACVDDSGYQYTTYEQIEDIIDGLADTEGYNSDCILNSETMQASVCNEFWNGESNATIMSTLSLTQEQLDYFLARCGDKPLDPQSQASICSLVETNATAGGIFTVSYIAFLLGLSEETVTEGIENCNEESTTTDSFTTTTLAPTTTEATTTEPTTTQAPATEAPTTTEATTTTTTKAPTVVVSSRRRRRRRRRRRWI